MALTRDLVSITGSRWPIANLKAMSKRRATILDIFNAILADKMEKISLDDFVTRARRASRIGGGNVLDRFVDDALADLPVVPIEEVKQVVEIIENRRQKFLENGATIGAGLLGAVIGSLLTFALTWSAAPPHTHISEAPSRSPIGAIAPAPKASEQGLATVTPERTPSNATSRPDRPGTP